MASSQFGDSDIIEILNRLEKLEKSVNQLKGMVFAKKKAP